MMSGGLRCVSSRRGTAATETSSNTSDDVRDLYENGVLRQSEEWGTAISEEGEALVFKAVDDFYRLDQLGPQSHLLRALRICRWSRRMQKVISMTARSRNWLRRIFSPWTGKNRQVTWGQESFF